MGTGCGTQWPDNGDATVACDEGSGPNCTNCPGAKYGLYGLLVGTPAKYGLAA